MQLGGIVGSIVALAALFLVFARWTGRVSVAAIADLFEPAWRSPQDATFRAALWRMRVGAALATLAVGILFGLVAYAFLPATAAGSGLGARLLSLAQWAVMIAVVVVAAVSMGTAVLTWLATEAAVARRRILLGFAPDDPPAAASAPETTTSGVGGRRRIVILCDGTGNRPDVKEEGSPATTNVWKLYRALRNDEGQVTWYDPGVATGTSSDSQRADRARRFLNFAGSVEGARVLSLGILARRSFEAITGTGITENAVQAYTEIVRHYRPGDRIYLIGFSRGAYTARIVAGIIARAGLLRSGDIRFATDLVHLYRTRPDPDSAVCIAPTMIHPRDTIEIEFLGLFDTVGSLGVPLWGWWFNWQARWTNRPLSTDPMRICRHVRHALAMDERRSTFFPTPFSAPRPDQRTTLTQTWFRGAHADIGGGYAKTGLSDITLRWMADAMKERDLEFQPGSFDNLAPDPMMRPHDELARAPGWRILGAWPRWHPVPNGTLVEDVPPSDLHPTVTQRSDRMQREVGRPDLLRPEGAVEVTVDAARQWDRTGVVLDPGTYRISYVGGHWRDAEGSLCGPDGLPPAKEGFMQRRGRDSRRLARERYMTLCLAVAHPRSWPLREGRLAEFFRHLFRDTPAELGDQTAPVGRDLHVPGDSVVLRNEAGSGLLYAFANDLWSTATNNAGGVSLRVERLDGLASNEPCWTLLPKGVFRAPEGR